MITPRAMLPKRFDFWRVEAAILASYRPTMPKFGIQKTAAQRTRIGKQAGWAKRLIAKLEQKGGGERESQQK